MTTRLQLTMRPPGLAQRIWYRRLGLPAPSMSGHTGPRHSEWVRLLPYRWRWVHHAYAAAFGYFWLPCDLCGRSYGGHEAGGDIPDPLKGPGHGHVICSRCTRSRVKAGLVVNA